MEYKRTSRHPSDETKAAISRSLKGVAKNAEHREHLSQSLKKYWQDEGNFPDDKESETKIEDIMF